MTEKGGYATFLINLSKGGVSLTSVGGAENKEKNHISIQLKRISILILIGFLKALIYLKKFLAFFFVMVLYKPLKYIFWKIIFQDIILKFYQFYILISQPIKEKLKISKNKLLYPFSIRYVIHGVIILMMILVTTDNIKAREIKIEEFGTKTILYSIVGDEKQEIVETAESVGLKNPSYEEKMGGVATTSKPEELTEVEELATVAQGGSTVIKPNIPITTIGNRPRDKVEYYIVEEGDTVSTIAEKFGTSTNTVLWENKLSSTSLIKPGDKLTILPASGISHQVQSGDTLEKIAKKYEVTVDSITEYNKLASAEAIYKDQILIIPGGTMPKPPTPVITQPQSRLASFFIPSSAPPIPGSKLQWPTVGRRIAQYFHWRHHGIDISSPTNSAVYSADSGRVESGGWGQGYGNKIVVNHGGGKKTLYAHLNRILVQPGESVAKGQTIGLIGCTGWCTGYHLHFEVIINGQKVNPLSYL